MTEEPARDAKGFCIQCGPNESGELISAIDMASPFKAFRGYHGNEAATKKKILNDVFVKGDGARIDTASVADERSLVQARAARSWPLG